MNWRPSSQVGGVSRNFLSDDAYSWEQGMTIGLFDLFAHCLRQSAAEPGVVLETHKSSL